MSMPAETPDDVKYLPSSPNGAALPVHLRALAGDPIEGQLVGRGFEAVESAGSGQQGRAGADRGDGGGLTGGGGNPSQQMRVVHFAAGTEAAWNEQDIHRCDVVDAELGRRSGPARF